MYDAADYVRMLADDRRVSTYLDAIRRVVRPGDVVLDIGTGPGVMAVAAAAAGATMVHGVDIHPVVALGRELAEANGVADRVRFTHGSSRSLPAGLGATVLIEDLRGILPLNADRFAVLRDARARLLASGARTIPRADTLWIAPCAADEAPPSAKLGDRLGDVAIGPLHRIRDGSWMRVRVGAGAPLAEPQRWATVDFSGALPDQVEGEVTFTFDRDVTVGGWCVWFDADLAPGVTLSNAPSAPPALYGQVWFPVATRVARAGGEAISVKIVARESADDWQWAWTTSWSTDGVRRTVRQSTLAGSIVDAAGFGAVAPDVAPSPHPQLGVYRTLLAAADGVRTHREIGEALMTAHPGRFATVDDAVAFATHRLYVMRSDDNAR